MQQVIGWDKNYRELLSYIKGTGVKKILLVCGKSLDGLPVGDFFRSLPETGGVEVVRFSGFEPNPDVSSAAGGVRLLRSEGCGLIAGVGGGSAMDIAKCIKLYANADVKEDFPLWQAGENDIPLLAIPTTAGTGSEATRFAVVYYKGEKQSVTHESIIPSAVMFDSISIQHLPHHQKQAGLLDALCHATESFWSVNSTAESREYSSMAIEMIMDNIYRYYDNYIYDNRKMLRAANLAGKAINITQTTAGHAMCYKLTKLYGIPHGVAASMCVRELFRFMPGHTELCADPRGREYLEEMFEQLAFAYHSLTIEDAADKFALVAWGDQFEKVKQREGDLDILVSSVNPERLKNNPLRLNGEIIRGLYVNVFCQKQDTERLWAEQRRKEREKKELRRRMRHRSE